MLFMWWILTIYANIRVTDIPTVQRLFPPKPATIRREIIMQNIKDKMMMNTKEYLENKCNEKGWIKHKNINRIESKGLTDIGQRIKHKEVVVFKRLLMNTKMMAKK